MYVGQEHTGTYAVRVTAREVVRQGQKTQIAKTNPLKYAGREHLYLNPSSLLSVGTRRWDQSKEQRGWEERKGTESHLRMTHDLEPGNILRLQNQCNKYDILWIILCLVRELFCWKTNNVSEFKCVFMQKCVKSCNHVHQA